MNERLETSTTTSSLGKAGSIPWVHQTNLLGGGLPTEPRPGPGEIMGAAQHESPPHPSRSFFIIEIYFPQRYQKTHNDGAIRQLKHEPAHPYRNFWSLRHDRQLAIDRMS